MAEIPTYPLYDSTFMLFRASPLFAGASSLLDPPSLLTHSRRLRDLLKGDNFRGIHIGAQRDLHGNLGPLEDCSWALLGTEAMWAHAHNAQAMEDSGLSDQPVHPETNAENARGIHIQLRYANATHSALLLRDSLFRTPSEGFVSFPLILLRMPQFLRDIIISHLSSTFDSRISPLRPRPVFILSALENHLQHIFNTSSPNAGPPASLKPLQISLSFPQITQSLRNMDVSISRDDVPGFLERGRAILSHPSSDLAIRTSTPFAVALSAYLSEHLALDPATLQSHVSRTACGSFAIATDGKFKIFSSSLSQQSGTERLVAELIREASSRMGFEDTDPLVTGAEDGVIIPTRAAKGAKGKKGKKRGSTRRGVQQNEGEEEELVDGASVGTGADADADRVLGSRRGRRTATMTPADPPPPYQLVDPAAAAAG